MSKQPVVGFCNVGMTAYYQDRLAGMVRRTLVELRRECAVAYSGEIFDIKTAASAARKVLRKDPDLLIIFFSTWVFAPIPIAVLQEARGVPLLLWPIPMLEGTTTGSLVAFAIAKGTLERMHRKFAWVYGMPAQAVPVILRQARLAHIITDLRRSRIGMIGGVAEGMFTADSDRLYLREKLGPEIVHIDGSIVVERMRRVAQAAITSNLEIVKKKIGIEGGDLLKKARDLIRMYVVLKELVREEGLSALSHKCMYELSSIVGCACLPLSLLVDDGIMCSDEGDIHAAITMLMLNKITGRPVFFCDFLNAEDDFIWFSTCGFIAPSLAKPGAVLRGQCVEIGEKGAIVSAEPREGAVTIARVDKAPGEGYRMHISKGAIVEGCRRRHVTKAGKELFLFPICKVRVKGGSDGFLKKVLSNHYVLAWDDCADDMIKLAEMMDIQVV